MKKYIYKITNLINKKSYIGQSNDYIKRWTSHVRGYSGSKKLFEDIIEYGEENFIFEILEYTSDFKNKEDYYINKFDSIKNGYNVFRGGIEPPTFKGEDSHFAKLNKEQYNEIVELLRSSNLPTKEIANKYNVSTSCINRINSGVSWTDESIKYPIRQPIRNRAQKHFNEIVNDLKFTNLTHKQIGEKYGISRTAVSMINRGENCYDANLDYPIRKVAENKVFDIFGIYEALKDNTKTITEIANSFNVGRHVVYKVLKDNKDTLNR